MGLVRLFLALSVAATHNGFILGGFFSGFFAVELFFAISGFCMALVLNQKYTGRVRCLISLTWRAICGSGPRIFLFC